MRIDDIPFLVNLSLGEGWICDPREFEIHRRSSKALAAVLISGKEVAGGVTVFAHKRSAWIGNLIVAPPWRGRGFATLLIKHALKWIDNRGYETVLLAASARAESLYSRLGFDPIIPIHRWEKLDGQAKLQEKALAFRQNRRRIVNLDGDCWGDDRGRLFKMLGFQRECTISTHPDNFLMFGPVGDCLAIGPGSIGVSSASFIGELFDEVLERAGSGHRIALDAFENNMLEEVLRARSFAVRSSTLLMSSGKKPSIKFDRILATASFGSMG